MTPDIIERLLATGHRARVVAAAKLGSKLACTALQMPYRVKKLEERQITAILCEAGYRFPAASVLTVLPLVKTLIQLYFDVYEDQRDTSIHQATKRILACLDGWVKFPNNKSLREALTHVHALHSAVVTWQDEHSDDGEDDDDGEDLDEDRNECEDIIEDADGEVDWPFELDAPPEDILYKAIIDLVSRTQIGSVHGVGKIESLRETVLPASEVQPRTRLPIVDTIDAIRDSLIRELLKVD